MKNLYVTRRIRHRLGFTGKKKPFLQIRFLFILIPFIALIVFSVGRIGALAVKIGSETLKNDIAYKSNSITAELLKDIDVTYSSIITQNSADGKINALYTDFTSINILKTQLTKELSLYLDSLSYIKAGVPAGTIFSNDILTGWGFKIPVYIAATANVAVDFSDTFESSGINQTKYVLMLNVKVDATVYGTSHRENITVLCDIPVAETVIVGDAPGMIL